MKKVITLVGGILAVVASVAAMSAYEAHVINVTAHIENALSVIPEEIMFGTVFPQEKLYQDLTIGMSESFFFEDRVDDIEYVIKQKPKPRPEFEREIGVVEARKWCHDNFPGFEFYPRGWSEYLANCYPPLCPYLSKMPDNDPANDRGLRSFHLMSAVAYGRLAKSEGDFEDDWVIDLDVPCFEGYCAQDWTHQGWELPYDLESETFGCDLWIEVTGISETPHGSECEPGLVYPCNTGLPGVCEIGTKTCNPSGYWGECISPESAAEICNDGLDNDCDGVVDEGDVCNSGPTPECTFLEIQSCGTQLLGVCAAGTQFCDFDGFWGSCVQDEQPSPETCDGLDNDCDGLTDEGDVCTPNGWTYEQKFNTLSDGDLNGQDGWSGSAGYDIQTAIKYEGAKGVYGHGSAIQISRTGLNQSSGTFYVAMRVHSLVEGGSFVLYTQDVSSNYYATMWIKNESGTYKLNYRDGGSSLFISNVSVDTWYILAIEIDKDHGGAGVHQWQFKWMEEGGSWSAWSGWKNDRDDTNGTINKIYFDIKIGGETYFDTITPTDPTP